MQLNYEVICKKLRERFERVREEAKDIFSEIMNIWSSSSSSIVGIIAWPVTIGRRYCWLDVASRDFGTPVASAASEAHDIRLHAHEDKVREEVHACRRVRESLGRCLWQWRRCAWLSTSRHAGWNEEREWVWDWERSRHIFSSVT